ncbi:hypothetical protein F511_40877 [Dorcoceras hygrometricum]|uniref:Uncharacterized protein n=1 Tax=Dorcoceras hygrometricum TaxID=472368 RepID=A0A2Z7CSX9_9LAMI|nr:hypothetical protein F511_40877 [Dorcoceras hygrometricum]
MLDTIQANHIDQIRETMALIPLLGIRIRPPIRQSGPRQDPILLRQTALEVLTRSARTDSSRRVGRKLFFTGEDGGGARRRRRRRERREERAAHARVRVLE